MSTSGPRGLALGEAQAKGSAPASVLLRRAYVMLVATPVFWFVLFVTLDALFEDGERSFGAIADFVTSGFALVLAAAPLVAAYALSCLACRRSHRLNTLIPAGLLVGFLGWWAVGIATAGSAYWWIPALVSAAGAVGIAVSYRAGPRPGGPGTQ